MAFIDQEKAFDSINTGAMFKAIRDQGIKETYVRLLDNIYDGCTGRIIHREQSEKFPIRKDVRQLGLYHISKIVHSMLGGVLRGFGLENVGLQIKGEYVNHLRFADDIVWLSESSELQNFFEDIQSESLAAWLKINLNQ